MLAKLYGSSSYNYLRQFTCNETRTDPTELVVRYNIDFGSRWEHRSLRFCDLSSAVGVLKMNVLKTEMIMGGGAQTA